MTSQRRTRAHPTSSDRAAPRRGRDVRADRRRPSPAATSTRSPMPTPRASTATWSSIRAFDTEATQPAAPGPAGPLAAEPRPGGRPGRLRPRRARRRTTSSPPTASTSSARSAASTRSTSSGCMRGAHPRRVGPDDPKNGNFHLYTLVLGSQTLHATGLRHGPAASTARPAPATPRRDAAVIVYYGDGASSQGDVHEAMVFAASYQTPAGVLPAEQPVGHLGAGRDASRARRCTCAARRLRHPEHPDRRQRRARQLRGHRASALDDARAGDGPRADRGDDLPHGRAHHERRPHEVPHLRRAGVLGRRATRSRASRAYLQGRGVEQDVLRRRSTTRPQTSPRTCASRTFELGGSPTDP